MQIRFRVQFEDLVFSERFQFVSLRKCQRAPASSCRPRRKISIADVPAWVPLHWVNYTKESIDSCVRFQHPGKQEINMINLFRWLLRLDRWTVRARVARARRGYFARP